MMKRLRVLFVEDSEDDVLLIKHELTKSGYEIEGTQVFASSTTRGELEKGGWDIIIADYIMPQFNALDALALYQEFKLDIPFIIVSGTIGEDIAVEAMKAGAHDYVMKDKLARLVPAIERELRDYKIREERRNAERSLRREEELLRLRYEALPAGIIVTSASGTITYVNSAACNMTGYTREEMIGFLSADDKWQLIKEDGTPFPAEDQPSALTLKTGKPLRNVVMGFPNKNEENTRWLMVNAEPVFSPETDEMIEVVVSFTDISSEKASQKELAQRKDLLQTVINNIPQYVFWKDKNLNYLGANKQFCSAARLDDEAEIIGKHDKDLWPERADDLSAHDRQIIASDTPELHVEHGNCPILTEGAWMESSKVPLHDAQGKVIGLLALCEDISERKRAEHDLRIMQYSIDHAAEAAFWVAEDGSIYYSNQTAQSDLGYNASEISNLKIYDLDSELTIEKWATYWERLKSAGSLVYETNFRRKGGDDYTVEITANYLEFDDKKYNFVFARDISEKKAAMERERMIREEAEEAKRQFYKKTISSVTDGKLNLVVYDDVDDMLGSDFTEIELTGPEKIAELRTELANLCDAVQMSEDRAFSLITAANEAAANAIKHAQGGTVKIGTHEDKVQVCVQDNGTGMDALVLPNATLMRRFSTKPSMGLGYSLILAMVDTVYLATDKQGTWVLMEKAAAEVGEEISLDVLPDNW